MFPFVIPGGSTGKTSQNIFLQDQQNKPRVEQEIGITLRRNTDNLLAWYWGW